MWLFVNFLADSSSQNVQYGHSWMRATVQAQKAEDRLASHPREELDQYLAAPLEDVENIVRWWGISLFDSDILCHLLNFVQAPCNSISYPVLHRTWLFGYPRIHCAVQMSILEWQTHSHCPSKPALRRYFWSPSDSQERLSQWSYPCVWASRSTCYCLYGRVGWWPACIRVGFSIENIQFFLKYMHTSGGSWFEPDIWPDRTWWTGPLKSSPRFDKLAELDLLYQFDRKFSHVSQVPVNWTPDTICKGSQASMNITT